LDNRAARHAADGMIQRLALERWAGRRTATLSQGNRQRLGLAAATLHDPALLILDEPTNALDPSGVALLRDLVAQLAGDGSAVLVSSHHLDEVARVAHRVSVVHDGQVIGALDPSGHDLERAFFAMVHAADTGLAQR
jgi:ABC-2 type transport system ATP-binding protein